MLTLLTFDSFAVTGLFRARASDLYGITAKSPSKTRAVCVSCGYVFNMVQFNSDWLVYRTTPLKNDGVRQLG